jgi:ParB-like chromosome segregation protein Spo0J
MTAAAKKKPGAKAPPATPKQRQKPSLSLGANDAAAQWMPLSKLKLWADNPRDNDGEPVARVVASIKEFGFGAPIVARQANGEIIAGHTRYKAAEALVATYSTAKDRAKWHEDAVRVATRKEVPTRLLDINERKAHLLALADNRHTELTPWSDSLSALLSEYSLDEATLAGWTDKDLEKLAKKVLDADKDSHGAGEGDGDGEDEAVRCPECGCDITEVFVRARVERKGKRG